MDSLPTTRRFPRLSTVEGYLALFLVAVMFLLLRDASFVLPIPVAIWACAWLFAVSGSRRAKGVARAAAIFSLVVLVLHGLLILLAAANNGWAQDSAYQGKAKQSDATRTLFGFTPFPYDFTLEAVEKTHALVVANSTIYALHFDDGIPWKEALADAPFPSRVQKSWNDQARRIPKGHKVYVGLAPLDTDRRTLAPATSEQKRVPMPEELRGVPLDAPQVRRAYLNYARRAVGQFKPHYLNLGIEVGGILMRDSKRWSQFERLYEHVRSALKKESPDVQIGISFSLGHLRVEAQAKAAQALIARSDYVGLSFYPSASAFDEKFGLPPYGTGPEAWRKPLAWVRACTNKPIALCETGYTTQDCQLPQFKLDIKGDPESQAAYVKELFEIASRDRYAFVIWFLAIDYDKLYAKMPPGSEVMKLWRNIGLLDGEVHPKPAWEIWKAGVERSRRDVSHETRLDGSVPKP